MLDWYSGKIGYSSIMFRPDNLVVVTADNEVRPYKEMPIQAVGSFDDTIQLRIETSTEAMRKASDKYGLLCNDICLYMSGNPLKFLQGHNVYGSSVRNLWKILEALMAHLNPLIRPPDYQCELPPAIHRNRVDIATLVNMGTHSAVHEWLDMVGKNSRTRHGMALVSGSTVYWGKHSRRWSLKAYCKFCELEKHKPKNDDLYEKLREYTETFLRIELTLRTEELKERGTLEEHLLWEYMEKIQVGETEMKKQIGGNLNSPMELTFRRWLNGEDVKFGKNRKLFYRHRLGIRKATGFDISMTPDIKAVKKANYDLSFLKANEVLTTPDVLQKHMFKVEDINQLWPAH